MAEKNFHFPSSTGSYSTPSGDIRIKIFYDDTSTTNTNVAADLHDIGNLDMEFSVDNVDGRFSQIQLTFLNNSNVFETEAIINSAKEKETFVDIYKDGTLFFRGILIHNEVKKTDYYLDGSTLKYNKTTLVVHDCLKYFWLNDVTLADVSYSSHILLTTLLTNIFTTYLYYGSGDVSIDSNIGAIDEACGNSYDITDFKLYGFESTMLVSTFLKNMMQFMACDVYSLADKINVVSKIDGSVTTIQTADVINDIAVLDNDDKIDYVAVSAYKDWGNIVFNLDHTHTASAGTDSENANKIELTADDFLDRIHTEIGGSNYFGDGSTTVAENVSATSLLDEDENFYTEEIETGMVAQIDCNPTPGMSSIIQSVDYSSGIGSTISYLDNGTPTLDPYRIFRQPYDGGAMAIYKVELLVQRAVNVYYNLFSVPEKLSISLIDIDTYKTIKNRFSFNSAYHRAKKASFDFMKNIVKLELLEV